jgi:hypothetical protein
MAAPEGSSRAHRRLLIIAMWFRSIGERSPRHFASDNLSLSAYAMEEILRVPQLGGLGRSRSLGRAAFSKVVPTTVALLLVLGILP